MALIQISDILKFTHQFENGRDDGNDNDHDHEYGMVWYGLVWYGMVCIRCISRSNYHHVMINDSSAGCLAVMIV